MTYMMAYRRAISGTITVLMFQFLSMATKGIYAAVLLDTHKDALIFAELALDEERRANESRREFLKYLFHEVRTPLNSLSIGIEILDHGKNLDEEERDSLMMMRGASEYMASTLNDVLSMQKIEDGKLELEMRSFGIEEIIHAVFATFKGSASAKGLILQYMIPIDMPEKLLGDRFRLEHVVGNFMSNAIKFSPHGGKITVDVSVLSNTSEANESPQRIENSPMRGLNALWKGRSGARHSPPVVTSDSGSIKEWKTIMVSVSDEGPGITLKNQSKLFDNFVQIRAGDLQNGQGSGLGLSLCKQIVQLHGGRVGVESEEGQGSRFYFAIPFQVVQEINNISISLHQKTETPHSLSAIHSSDTNNESGVAFESSLLEVASFHRDSFEEVTESINALIVDGNNIIYCFKSSLKYSFSQST